MTGPDPEAVLKVPVFKDKGRQDTEKRTSMFKRNLPSTFLFLSRLWVKCAVLRLIMGTLSDPICFQSCLSV